MRADFHMFFDIVIGMTPPPTDLYDITTLGWHAPVDVSTILLRTWFVNTVLAD